MKILFVGDKQHVHNCLADALKRMGHTVTIASTEKSGNIPEGGINLRTPNGLFGSATLLARVLFALPRMKGYDVVDITGTYFLDLPLSMVLKVYNFLRKHNKKVVISALDTDFYYVKTCYEGMQLRYNEYLYNNRLTPYSICHKKETQKFSPKNSSHG
jgi:CheY-like chemotaxis protein